jgi:hypothetical protein
MLNRYRVSNESARTFPRYRIDHVADTKICGRTHATVNGHGDVPAIGYPNVVDEDAAKALYPANEGYAGSIFDAAGVNACASDATIGWLRDLVGENAARYDRESGQKAK